MAKVIDINYDGSPLRIRPSSIDNFYNCAFQWAKVFLGGTVTIPNARAAIGTAVHRGVEEMWLEAKLKQSKEDINLQMMTDAAIQEFQELDQDLFYDNGEDSNTAEETVSDGCRVYVEDITPFAEIPDGVEEFFKIDIDHPIVKEIGGTVDYRTFTEISDVKTSKRKPVPQSHVVQQSTYKILAEANGHTVDRNTIQGVAFTKNPVGYIMELEPNVPRTKFLINQLLDTLEAYYNGADPKTLFRGNPKYYLCDPRYCNLYSRCPYVNGDA